MIDKKDPRWLVLGAARSYRDSMADDLLAMVSGLPVEIFDGCCRLEPDAIRRADKEDKAVSPDTCAECGQHIDQENSEMFSDFMAMCHRVHELEKQTIEEMRKAAL